MILGRGSQPSAAEQNTFSSLPIPNGLKFNYSLEKKMDPECAVCKAAGRSDFKSHTSTNCPNRKGASAGNADAAAADK